MEGRDIPLPIKRLLRQEAGFGCCVCGHPFIEYHHIRPYAQDQQHDPADMMVLCPNHHHQATVGALTEEHQRAWKATPFNIKAGLVQGQLLGTPTQLAITVGGVQFVGAGFKLLVDGQPLLHVHPDPDGHLLLSLTLYDETDSLLMELAENEWIAGDPLPWDLEYGYNLLRLRHAERDIRLTLNARVSPVNITGRFYWKGQVFNLTEASITVDGTVRNAGVANLCFVGRALEIDTVKAVLRTPHDPRLGGGSIISWPDPAERLAQGFDAYNRLLQNAPVGRNELCPCGSGRKAKNCHKR